MRFFCGLVVETLHPSLPSCHLDACLLLFYSRQSLIARLNPERNRGEEGCTAAGVGRGPFDGARSRRFFSFPITGTDFIIFLPHAAMLYAGCRVLDIRIAIRAVVNQSVSPRT